MKRWIHAFLCCMILVSVLINPAYAKEEPDFNRKGSISISVLYHGQKVSGGTMTLHRIADVHEQNGADFSFRYTNTYAGCSADLTKLDSPATAQTIADYVAEKNKRGVKQTISQDGAVKFENLQIGLYLLVQEDAAPGYGRINPFLVSVPGRDGERYLYDVNGSPKLSLERLPDIPEAPEKLPSGLPQTGLNQWPIPVLAISGLVTVLAGVALLVAGKKEKNEG